MLAQPDRVVSRDALSEAVVEALVAEKLYEKEARAMVKTWQSSWFGEQGTRLFYMLPAKVTDELLPLEIKPSPDEIVRVMVGRLEIMTPEDEAKITELVATSAVDRAASHKKDKTAPYALPKSILKMGRLAEPALVRVKNISGDIGVRSEAASLLKELHAVQAAEAIKLAIQAAQR